MKISHLSWSALVVLAFMGLPRTAVSLDPWPSEAESGSADSGQRQSETRGLLAHRFSTFAPKSSGHHTADKISAQPDDSTVQAAGWSNSLGGGSLAMDSGACDACDCCPDPLWVHRSGVFADLLILRPGNIDYVYAVEQTGTLPTDSPTGQVGRVGFDTAAGYRFGFNYAISDCTSLQASYTWFEDGTNDTVTATPGNVLVFQPGHPSIPNVGGSSIQSTARYDIKFQQLDLDYRGLLWGSCDSAVNYFAGLRYANLEQRFGAEQTIGVPIGLTTVNTDIDFDGFGIGFGIDGMRRSAYSGLLIYGRASSSFVSGEFKADYLQTTQFGPNSVVGNSLVDFRVMTILQSELGLGWQSACGTFRVQTGYQFAGWFNSLTTGTYIAGVQNRQFDELWETVTFDGFVGRVEWRF